MALQFMALWLLWCFGFCTFEMFFEEMFFDHSAANIDVSRRELFLYILVVELLNWRRWKWIPPAIFSIRVVSF